MRSPNGILRSPKGGKKVPVNSNSFPLADFQFPFFERNPAAPSDAQVPKSATGFRFVHGRLKISQSLVGQTVSRFGPGIGLAPFADGMMINGAFSMNDNPVQEAMNGEVITEDGSQGGDFSALLFLILATPAAQNLQVQDAEGSLTAVSSGGGSNVNSTSTGSADLYDASDHVFSLLINSVDLGSVDVALGNTSAFVGSANTQAMPDMTMKGEAHRDANHSTNNKNGLEISALETGVDDAGTSLTKLDMSTGVEVRQGNHNNIELRDAHALLRGLPAYAKDNLVQTKSPSEPHDRALSETILSSGETRSADPNQGEQGMFFQRGDHEPSDEGMHGPFETAQHSNTMFHVARLTDSPPSAARGAEPAQWRPVIEQVAGEINGRVHIGKTDAIIQLDPPELGKLKIDIHLEGDRLEARIFTETQESRRLIETHLPELRQALGQNRLEHVDVRVESGSWGSARGDGHQGPRQDGNGGRQSANDFGATARGGNDERELVQRQATAQKPGRVSMWA
jgi:flagellar hook-length control protein FliK